jgi:hypothetical protein
MNAPSPATLFDRYLAQCAVDAAALLAQVCRDAGAPRAGGSVFLAPAQRRARELLPAMAAPWAAQLAQHASAAAAPRAADTAPGASFLASGFGVPSGLALMSDDDVDEDIESTRLVQAIESMADWSLRDLRSRLASTPTAAGAARDEVLPLAPARMVNALCAALHAQPVEPGVRLAAMRTVAEPLAQALAGLYQRHAQLLAEWGVEPARYTIRRDPDARAPRAGAGADKGAAPTGDAVTVPTAQIPALLAHVAAEAGLSTGMQALMVRLAAPVARSVGADPRLLESMDNPLWRLIDRLAALGQLDSDAPAGGGLQLPLHLRLEPIVARLESGPQPMPGERYAQALKETEAEALHLRAGQPSQAAAFSVSGLAPQALPDEPALAAEERRQTLEPLVRQQMVARLRDSHVLPEVKQFLLGPWLDVVVQAVVLGGEEAPSTQRVLGAVEALIDGGSYQRRAPLTPAELACLRMEAGDGLKTTARLTPERAARHLDDLADALARWPRRAPDTAAPADALFDEDEADLELPRHDELATVPIALDAHNPDEGSLRACEAWLDSLAVGDLCRIQRQGQWASLRLNWRSDSGTYFAFGNGAGLAFCASRRVLGRMRLEGLATTMARGHWLRRAVDTMPMALD